MSNSLQLHGLGLPRLLTPWNSPGKNPGVDSHSLLQGIFPTQGSNVGLLHCGQILYHLSHREALPPNTSDRLRGGRRWPHGLKVPFPSDPGLAFLRLSWDSLVFKSSAGALHPGRPRSNSDPIRDACSIFKM